MTYKRCIKVVRKLQFLNNFLIKIAFLQGFARKNARLVREPTGFPNKSIIVYILTFLIFSSCLPIPYYATFYENLEFPAWTESGGIWSLDNEQWFMRGYDHSGRNKKRDTTIIAKYLLNNALCYVGIRAKDETTVYSKNPYSIGITVYGLSGIHTSFSIKQINVNSTTGNDLSHLANDALPVTIAFNSESSTTDTGLVRGYYGTEKIFNFKKETIIVTFTLEINTINGSETGSVVFELNPVVKWGLFQSNF